jgi:class 3 adenylate cyclase/tetratricopeptide (TPR) repeat protein
MAALESQRQALGDAVTDLALAPLRQQLSRLEQASQLRRAQVTVMFADIVGSTELASRLDAEDVLQLFGSLLERAAACVRARGGRVLRFTGDGLKAAFGTQGAQEDDAARAVQAGLDILADLRQHIVPLQQRLGAGHDLNLRVGLHTGDVVFGAGFEDDDTLTGDAVNVAARMEQSAPPGALRVSADTWALVRGQFVAEAQAPLQLKGIDRPMNTWLVRAAGASGAERGIEGQQPPLAGRAEELAQLQQILATGDEGSGLRHATLVGDAGLGKSRLLREALSGDGHRWTLLTARAHPRDSLRSWGLLRQLLTGYCRIADSDSAQTARDKLVAGLMPGFAEDAETQSQLVGQLIGLAFSDAPVLQGLDARALRDRALAALLSWLDGLARQGPPLVLLIEDLHWADDTSLDALAHLMTRGQSLPLALLMSTRPELLERQPGWADHPGGARITLSPLAEADADTLVAALLPGLQPVPPALKALLTDRAQGNPYYLEELVRRLLDDGVINRDAMPWQLDEARLQRLRLPATLVGLLQARLDALPSVERQVAQQASVVGHVFWDAALAQINPLAVDVIPALQQRSWVLPHEPGAFDGTTERQFDHHLLHQVTYSTVVKDERRRGHAAVARWLAERTAGRGPEFLAITGEHAERAGDHALAADCFERAAAEAFARFANTLAIECYQRAIQLMAAHESTRRLKALSRLGDVADLVGNRELQQQTIEQALAVLAAHPDPYQLAGVTIDRALLADRLGQADEAFALATDALAQADAGGNDDAAALAHGELCWLHGQRGEHEAAHRHLAAGQIRAAKVRDSHPIREVQLLMMAAVVAIRADHPLEAGALLEQALQRAEATRDARRLSLSAFDLLSEQMRSLGEWSQAMQWAERGLAAARMMGDSMRESQFLLEIAFSAVAIGDTDRAEAALAQARPLARAAGAVLDEARLCALAGHIHVQRGQPAAARKAYEQARTLYAGREPDGEDMAAMRALVARQDLALGDRSAARAGAEQASAVLEAGAPPGTHHFDWDGRLACIEVLAALGDAQAAALLATLQDAVRRVSLARAGGPEAAHELQQRIPIFRAILAAAGGPTTSAAAS